MKRSPDRTLEKLAISHVSSSAAVVGIAIDAAGYGRAKFVFTFGTPLTTVAPSLVVQASSIAIWGAYDNGSSVAAASAYAVIPGAYLAAATWGALSNNVAVLDIAIPAGREFLKVSGSLDSTLVPHNATVELYQPVTAPPTTPSPAPVILN